MTPRSRGASSRFTRHASGDSAMTSRARFVLRSSSIVAVVIVVGTAALFGPRDLRVWLLLCGALAVIAAAQAATLDPSDLTPALLLSLPPVIALLADGSPTWMIGPLGALLLVAGELNVLSWESQGIGPASGARRRLLNTTRLAGLGLAAALPVALLDAGQWLSGTTAVLLAAGAIAGLGALVFGRGV